MNEIYRRAANGEGQLVSYYKTVDKPKAIIQFVHDISEYCGRYDEMFQGFTISGYDVYANDIVGHGMSKQGHKGAFSMHDDALDFLLDDIHTLFEYAQGVSGEIPKVLIGIGFGAVLSELYASKHSDVDMLIVVAPMMKPKAISTIKSFSRHHTKIFGANKNSAALQNMILQTNKMAGSDPANQYYWLSNDKDVCRQYAEDPDCGFPLTGSAYDDVLKAFKMLNKDEGVASIPDIPVFILAGKDDQIGECGEAAVDTAAEFNVTGHSQVALKLYPDCCHDLFHESVTPVVMRDISTWIAGNL